MPALECVPQGVADPTIRTQMPSESENERLIAEPDGPTLAPDRAASPHAAAWFSSGKPDPGAAARARCRTGHAPGRGPALPRECREPGRRAARPPGRTERGEGQAGGDQGHPAAGSSRRRCARTWGVCGGDSAVEGPSVRLQIRFVTSPRGNYHMTELLAALCAAARELGHDAELVGPEFPRWRRETTYVVIPHQYYECEPMNWPSREQRARTIALCVENPFTQWFEKVHALAPQFPGMLPSTRPAWRSCGGAESQSSISSWAIHRTGTAGRTG